MLTNDIPLGVLFQKIAQSKPPIESREEPLDITVPGTLTENLVNVSKVPPALSTESGLILIRSGKLSEDSMLLIFSLNPSQEMAMAVLQQAISLEGILTLAESEKVSDMDAFWTSAVEKIDFGSLSDEELSALAKFQHYAIFAKLLKTWKYSPEDTMELLKLCKFHPKFLLAILEDSDLPIFFQAIHTHGWEEQISFSLISIFESDSISIQQDVLIDFARHIDTASFWDFVARRVSTT